MANLIAKIVLKMRVWKPERSSLREEITSVTAHKGHSASLRIMCVIVALLLLILIKNANDGAKTGLPVKMEPQYINLTDSPGGNPAGPEETHQASTNISTKPSTFSLSSFSSRSPHTSNAQQTAQPPVEPSAEPDNTTEKHNTESAPNKDSTTGKHDTESAPNGRAESNPTGKRAVASPNETEARHEFPEPDKIAYITIDDGPSREITPGILDVLMQEGVKATFFVLPHSGVDDIYRRIIEEGHEVGNHSYSHVYSELYKSSDVEVFREDILLAQAFIFDNYGYLMTTFRFPGGAMSRKSSIIIPRREILAEMGYQDFDWNVDTGDTRSSKYDKSAVALTSNVLDNTRGREQLIVLMHDTKNKTTTLEALPFIITGLREQGYSFDVLRNYCIP